MDVNQLWEIQDEIAQMRSDIVILAKLTYCIAELRLSLEFMNINVSNDLKLIGETIENDIIRGD